LLVGIHILATMSNPRPIHNLNRDLRQSPDDAEPSFSYEDSAFLLRGEEHVEAEFHRRLQRPRGGGGGSGEGGSGSFWRTSEAPVPQWPGVAAGGSAPIGIEKITTVKERKTSGGLLGAALQLHSQSDATSDRDSTFISPSNGRRNTSSVSSMLGEVETFNKSDLIQIDLL